jgi:hypothetical protein
VDVADQYCPQPLPLLPAADFYLPRRNGDPPKAARTSEMTQDLGGSTQSTPALVGLLPGRRARDAPCTLHPRPGQTPDAVSRHARETK